MVNLRFSQIKKPDSLPLCFRIKNQAQVLCVAFLREIENQMQHVTCKEKTKTQC